MGSKFDVKFDPLPADVHQRLQEAFPASGTPIRSTPGNFMITNTYEQYAEFIYNFPLDAKDVWVVTYPKSGTTWTQEQVWLVANDLDFERAKKNLTERFPFLEIGGLPPEHVVRMWAEAAKTSTLETGRAPMLPADIARIESPRFVKSHLPFYLLPPKLLDTCKTIYVARNPKDVCVSWYFHHKLMKFMDTPVPFSTFMDFFMKDELLYSPFWDHLKKAWELRNHPNMLFLFYEDMKTDLVGQLKKIAKFLNKEYTDEQFNKLKSHLVIDTFKKNPAVNEEHAKESGAFNKDGNFIRKGKTGNWKDHFTPEMNAKFDAWIVEHSKDTTLRFKYEVECQD